MKKPLLMMTLVLHLAAYAVPRPDYYTDGRRIYELRTMGGTANMAANYSLQANDADKHYQIFMSSTSQGYIVDTLHSDYFVLPQPVAAGDRIWWGCQQGPIVFFDHSGRSYASLKLMDALADTPSQVRRRDSLNMLRGNWTSADGQVMHFAESDDGHPCLIVSEGSDVEPFIEKGK